MCHFIAHASQCILSKIIVVVLTAASVGRLVCSEMSRSLSVGVYLLSIRGFHEALFLLHCSVLGFLGTHTCRVAQLCSFNINDLYPPVCMCSIFCLVCNNRAARTTKNTVPAKLRVEFDRVHPFISSSNTHGRIQGLSAIQ